MDMVELGLDTEFVSTDKFSCIICKNVKFKTNARLFKHLLNTHKDSSTICRFCQRTFFSKQDYINHASKHSNTNSHVYKCSICPQSFFSKAFLLEHQKKHSSVSNYVDGFMHKVVKVDDSEVDNKLINKYKKHVLVAEKDGEDLLIIPDGSEENDPFSTVGNYIYRSMRKTEKSIKNTAKSKRKYVKVKRGPGSRKKDPNDQLDNGDSSTVVRDKLMECLEGIVYDTATVNTTLNTKSRTNKRYFEDGSEMDIPEGNAEENLSPLHLVKKRNVSVSVTKTLQEILKSDHSLNMLACDECDQLFSSQAFLSRHMAAHTKRNLKYKYVCKYCSVRYCAPNRLFAHFSKFHKNETPFSCEICSVTFVKKVDFSSHIQSNHKADGIIKFLESGLIAYVCKSKIPAEVSSEIDGDSSGCKEDVAVKDDNAVGEQTSDISIGELSQGKVEELRHWKGGLLKHWEGGGDNLNTEKGDKLSSLKGDDLHLKKSDDVVLEKGDNLSPEKGDKLSSLKGDDLHLKKSDDVVLEKGDNLSPEKGDKLTTLKGDNLHPDKSDDVVLEKGDNLIPGVDDTCSEKDDSLNLEKVFLNLGDDEMHPENGENPRKYDERSPATGDDNKIRRDDDFASDKEDPCDKLNLENDDIKSPENEDILTLEKYNDMSIELEGALGLRKVNTSENSETLSPEKGSKRSRESPIKTKSKRPTTTKRPKFTIEISDTEESSWDEHDDEPLSVIRKSKSFKAVKKPKHRLSERCDICDLKLKAGSMKKHKKRHSNNQRFHCHLCKLSMKEEFKFHLHMKTHFQHDKFLCICGVRLPNKQSLDEHKRNVHSKDNQTQNLTMIRSVENLVKHGRQSSLQSSQVLVKKINERPRVFNVQSSQGKVADVVKNLIRKVDPRAFAGSVSPSLFKERALNFTNVASPVSEKKKMNFTIKMISPQEAEKRNKIAIKPVPAASLKVLEPAFNIQQTSVPKFQDVYSRIIKKTDGFNAKPFLSASPNIGKVASQDGKRKYLKVNVNDLIKSGAKLSPVALQSVNGLHLVTANPLAHLIGDTPVGELNKTPTRKGKSFDYVSIIQKSLLDQM